jgi:Ni,Fe-hydrogenase III large subunit/Ni,Fe-hydrogenase III component G
VVVESVDTRLVQAFGPLGVAVAAEAGGMAAVVSRSALRETCATVASLGAPLVTMVATDDGDAVTLRYVFSLPATAGERRDGSFVTIVCAVPISDLEYPSVTPLLPAAHWYEREARDLFGVVPVGHPDPRRLVLHDDWPRGYHPLRKNVDGHRAPPHGDERPYPFRPVHGHGISEVPVGPIHAGIIEPGHFRFSVIGERVIHLEARLFYVHRGIEKLCEGLPVERALEIVERICGVCTLSHATAYCQAVEAIAGTPPPPRAVALRTALLELERLYNHIGDVGNICAGVGLAVGTMAGARLKDQAQSLAERLSGSRYLRGVVRPGGLRRALDAAAVDDLRSSVEQIARAFKELEGMLLATPSLMERMEGTGTLPLEAARDLGAVGVAARASGVARDIRLDHPYAAYAVHPPRRMVETSGDVRARFMVRVAEAHEAARLIGAILDTLPEGPLWAPPGTLPAGGHALGWAESPRGEHVHWVRIGDDGTVDRLRVRAASYCNWPVVALAVSGNMVPDFPLINKSFELSYSSLDR